MKRLWYAGILLALLAVAVSASAFWVQDAAGQIDNAVRTAYACALQEDYVGSRAAYLAAVELNRAKRHGLDLFVRRSLLDKIGETLATLPSYATPDNMADLSVETARVREQLRQMTMSYLAWF
ncbi:MAG: hypothetical protein ACI4OL_05080 [Gemmiger sp.]